MLGYSTNDLELLSVHLNVKYFAYMLLDKCFVIFNNHKSDVNSLEKPSKSRT